MKSLFGQLPKGILILIFAACYLLAANPKKIAAQSQTSLTTGDAAFTGYIADDPNAFSVVLFKAVAANQTINFSSEEWDGAAFSGAGGHLVWTAPSGGITAGTVLVFDNVGATPKVNIGSIDNDSNINLTGSGDVIYAYTGSISTPDTFLGAIATAGDEYGGGQGTLTNTGLSRGTSAILLSENIDDAQYIGDRGGDTPQGYRLKLNNINGENSTTDNWNQVNGSGDQSGQIRPLNQQKLVLVQPPTIAFSTDNQVITEGNTLTITVKLVQANNTAVSADVKFLSGASSATSDDINGQRSSTVQFLSTASSGDTKTITISVPANNGFEGSEKAVFQLQNNSAGTFIKPKTQTVLIKDSKTPNVVINEFLADPAAGSAGDANGDGTRSSSEDEFIEIVNNSASNIDISGWELSDDGGSSIRYAFPSGTVLVSKQAAVVFGGGKPTGNFGGAIVQASGGLSLGNTGDEPTLLNENGVIIQSVPYGGSGQPDGGDNQSVTRSPDITGSFVEHSSADSGDQSLFSPGTKVDGTTFDNTTTYAVGLTGKLGWRFVATPTKNTTFDDLFHNLWTQGILNSDAPTVADSLSNLKSWDESAAGSFVNVADMNNTMIPGKGYLIYQYPDNDYRTPGLQGGFPNTVISTTHQENGNVSVPVRATDGNGDNQITDASNEGFNLLGNPYGTDISVDAVLTALADVSGISSSDVNQNVYVYDANANNGNGSYLTLSSGDTISPFQAFFMRYTKLLSGGTVNFTKNKLAANIGAQFYGRAGSEVRKQRFNLYLSDGKKSEGAPFDNYQIQFDRNGKVGVDRFDAYKLFSLNPNAINLFSTVGDGTKLAKNVLPVVNSLNSRLRIPLTYVVPHSGKYHFSWSGIPTIPRELILYLVDNKTGRKVDLRTSQELTFNAEVKQHNEPQRAENKRKFSTAVVKSNSKSSPQSRFEILAVPASVKNQPKKEQKKAVEVSNNYPNPFINETTMDVKLKNKMHLTMTIYNIVGQKITTIVDKTMNAGGPYHMSWKVPANMPSGIYLCKIKAGQHVLSRKMTLVK